MPQRCEQSYPWHKNIQKTSAFLGFSSLGFSFLQCLGVLKLQKTWDSNSRSILFPHRGSWKKINIVLLFYAIIDFEIAYRHVKDTKTDDFRHIRSSLSTWMAASKSCVKFRITLTATWNITRKVNESGQNGVWMPSWQIESAGRLRIVSWVLAKMDLHPALDFNRNKPKMFTMVVALQHTRI